MGNSDNYMDVYKGKGLYTKHIKTNTSKIFVFDLDETIGSFQDLYILFKCIENLNKLSDKPVYENDEQLIFSLLDEFPEFFRYGIDILFKYLNEKKKIFNCIHVYIYTNNTCIPITWTSIIIKYIEQKWNLTLFDNIVRCFKINDQIIEYKRTSSDKTFNDLIRCIKLSYNTELCFIDNVLFPKMRHRHVYYLRPKPYYHYINREDILNRFLVSPIGKHFCYNLKISSDVLFNNMHKWYSQQGHSFDKFVKSTLEMEQDIEVSKKLLYHCRLFFYITTKKIKTRKNISRLQINKTKKNR